MSKGQGSSARKEATPSRLDQVDVVWNDDGEQEHAIGGRQIEGLGKESA